MRTFQPQHREQALEDLDRAVELEPDAAWVRCERASSLRITGHNEAALADFDRAIELDRGYARAYTGRGATLGNLGRYPEALSDLNRAVELFPLDAWSLSRRCWVYLKLGAFERALADATHALALTPGDTSTLLHRAEVLHGLGRFEDARADLEATIERGFGQADTWSPGHRINFCLAVGRLQQAQADLHFYLERGVHKAVVQAQHKRARIHLLSGESEQAIATLQDSRRVDPQEPAVLETLCTALRRTGRKAAAWRIAEQLRLSDEARGLACLALTLEAYSDRQAAQTGWQAAGQALHQARLPAQTLHQFSTVVFAALDSWPTVDAHLAHILAPSARWIDLAELGDRLEELLHTSGSDHTRLEPRLTALKEACDALQARYA